MTNKFSFTGKVQIALPHGAASPCMLETGSIPQTVPLGEILMLDCVPPQHQNQLTTVAHQSLKVLIQRRIEFRVKHENPVPLFVDLLGVIPCQFIQYFWMLTPLPLRFCSFFHCL